MVSANPIQIFEKEWSKLAQAPWTMSISIVVLSVIISGSVYEWIFKEIVSHQQMEISMLRDQLKARQPNDLFSKPSSTANQTNSGGGVNAASSDVKTGDIGCPSVPKR